MILSDVSIKIESQGNRLIDPFNSEQLQPASYDLRLAEIMDNDGFKHLFYPLIPGEFVLGSTFEKVNIPDDLVGRLEGKSTWARKGLIIHTAGFVDPGFKGTLTLEITNFGNKVIDLNTGDLICQIAFSRLDQPAERPYGHKDLKSHYQNQNGVTQAK